MIKVETQVPSNYYARSRDFQLLGRLYDAAINSSKLYADLLGGLFAESCSDSRMLGLMMKTVGFDEKRKYEDSDLIALRSSFKHILRMKGSRGAVEACVRLLLRAQNISDLFNVYISNTESTTGSDEPLAKYEVKIVVPVEMHDVALLEDLLDYVLPAGYVYSIVVAYISDGAYGSGDAAMSNSVSVQPKSDSELGNVYDHTDATQAARGTAYATEMSTVYGGNGN
jgi:hypothetical protein